jgi:hypothetical protein
LPALKEVPVEVLTQMTRSEIFLLNTALIKESKVTGKLQTSAKLTLNAQQLAASPVAVPAG